MKNKEKIRNGIFAIFASNFVSIPFLIEFIELNRSKIHISEALSIFPKIIFVISFAIAVTIIGIILIIDGIKGKNLIKNIETNDINTTIRLLKKSKNIVGIGVIFCITINTIIFFYRWNIGMYETNSCINALVTEIIEDKIIIEYETGNQSQEETIEYNQDLYSNIKVGDYIKVHCKKEKKNRENWNKILLEHIASFFYDLILFVFNPLIWFTYMLVDDYIKKHNKNEI